MQVAADYNTTTQTRFKILSSGWFKHSEFEVFGILTKFGLILFSWPQGKSSKAESMILCYNKEIITLFGVYENGLYKTDEHKVQYQLPHYENNIII